MDRTGGVSAHAEGRPQSPRPPRFAPPARGILHGLIGLAGWVLFAWSWWIVLRSVTRGPLIFTALFIAVSLVMVVAVNYFWARHNVRIWEERGPRLKVRHVPADWARDRLGRAVTFEGSLRRIQTERAVDVVFDDERKVYRPVAAMNLVATAGDVGQPWGAP